MFKVGDRVKLVSSGREGSPSIAELGMVGTVIGIPKESIIAIDLDGIPRNHGVLGEGWWFHPIQLELVGGGRVRRARLWLAKHLLPAPDTHKIDTSYVGAGGKSENIGEDLSEEQKRLVGKYGEEFILASIAEIQGKNTDDVLPFELASIAFFCTRAITGVSPNDKGISLDRDDVQNLVVLVAYTTKRFLDEKQNEKDELGKFDKWMGS